MTRPETRLIDLKGTLILGPGARQIPKLTQYVAKSPVPPGELGMVGGLANGHGALVFGLSAR